MILQPTVDTEYYLVSSLGIVYSIRVPANTETRLPSDAYVLAETYIVEN